MKLSKFLLCGLLLSTVIELQAQEFVVLECSNDEGKWVATIEINLKNKKLQYDNAIDRFSVENWNKFRKEYAFKDDKELEPKRYEVPIYEIKKITNSEIWAVPLTFFSLRGDLKINRYTLELKDKYGDFKCQKRQKEF